MKLRIKRCAAILTLLAGAFQALGVGVSSFTPSVGSPGEQVTINGSGFFPGTIVVRFNGVVDPTAQATAADGTIIMAQVPATATTGPISVQVNGGTPASSLSNFTVIGAGPYITDFTPNSGGSGAHVTINGVHFISANVTNAYFNGKPGINFFLQSDISATVDAPVGVTTGPISVRSQFGGANTNANNFFAPPVVTGFSPTLGRTGTNVTITGTNFLGATAVWFGTLSTTALTILSNGAVRVAVPVNADTGKVRVDAPGGSAMTTSNFVVLPTIYGFSPGTGAPPSSITVTGANFLGTSSVLFNGTAGSFSSVTFGQLTAVVPGAATSGPLTITTTNGSAVSLDYFYVPASITSFTPTNAPPGSTVRITGNNFTNTSAVSFNGTPAASFVVTNNTTIGAVVPANFATGPIKVTTPAGTATSSGQYYAAPFISGFTPAHGLTGTNVLVTGSSLLGATAIQFNGVNGTGLNVLSNGAAQVTVPAGAQTGPLTVIAPAGTFTTSSNFVFDSASDLGVTLTASPNPVLLSTNLVYAIQITNFGPNAATNVRITNTLPSSVTLRAFTVSQGSLNLSGNQITGNLGTINANGSALVTLTVGPQTVGNITNVVTIASDFGDPIPSNNTTNIVTTVLPLAVLSIQQVPPDKFKISWPVQLTNFALQYNTVLSSNIWTNVATSVTISNSERLVIETNTVPAKFYRLHD